MKAYTSFKYIIRLTIISACMIHYMNAQVIDTIRVESGWNLMSLPLSVIEGDITSIFPSATSDAFIYYSSYIPKDTLENGYGIWVKFDSAETLQIVGDAIYEDTIDVVAGWNMIGPLSTPIPVDSIIINPSDIINSEYFCYVPGVGYQSSDTLRPSLGYFVKFSDTGKIILHSPQFAEEGNRFIQLTDSVISVTADSILLTDNPLSGWIDKLQEYSEYSSVDSVHIRNNHLLVQYRTGEIHTWYKSQATVQGIEQLRYAKSMILNNNAANNHVLLCNACYDDNSRRGAYEGEISILDAAFRAAGFVVDIKRGTEITVDFLKTEMKKYRIIYYQGHGSFDGFPFGHGIQTGEYIVDNNTYREDRQQHRISTFTTDINFTTVHYQMVHEKFFDFYYEDYCFPSSSLIYLSNCQMFKGADEEEKNSLAQVLNEKGVSAIVGWDDEQCKGFWVGKKLLQAMLTNGTNLETEFTKLGNDTIEYRFITKIGNYERSDCGLGDSITKLTYYPRSSAGELTLYENNPPELPTYPNPPDGSTNQSTSLTLSWNCSDPDAGDILTYDVYLQDINPPTNIFLFNQTDTYCTLNSLQNNKTYYWKIVAKDNHNTETEGPVWTFTTQNWVSCPETPTVTYGGKVYNTVLIGTQCWLKENLDVGTRIIGTQQQTNNGIIEKYCYNNDPANCNTYGGLYKWSELMQYDISQGVRGICPYGWHIPTNSEFQTLKVAVGGDGNSLKAIGQGVANGTGTNTSGFSLFLAGFSTSGGYGSLGYSANLSSSTFDVVNYICYLRVMYDDSDIDLDEPPLPPEPGYSVRCIQD